MKLLAWIAMICLPILALGTSLDQRSPNPDDSTLVVHHHEARATLCGSGYNLKKAIPLPRGVDPSVRKATLFAYQNGGKGCLVLDNNVGAAQYMYLHVCRANGKGCDTDTGRFSQYAGPVYVGSLACAKVTAKMGKTSSKLYINYKSDYVFACN